MLNVILLTKIHEVYNDKKLFELKIQTPCKKFQPLCVQSGNKEHSLPQSRNYCLVQLLYKVKLYICTMHVQILISNSVSFLISLVLYIMNI